MKTITSYNGKVYKYKINNNIITIILPTGNIKIMVLKEFFIGIRNIEDYTTIILEEFDPKNVIVIQDGFEAIYMNYDGEYFRSVLYDYPCTNFKELANDNCKDCIAKHSCEMYFEVPKCIKEVGECNKCPKYLDCSYP